MNVDQQEVSALERHVGDQATSPLFARLAALYLASDRAKDALRICDAGLANFPFYSTGHLIKGKALLQLGLNGEARREFEFVRDWLPTNPTVAELLVSVPMSEDQMLEAAPAEEATPGTSFEEASEPQAEALAGSHDEPQAGSDFFGAVTAEEPPEVVVEGSAEEASAAPQEDNVFGLPGEVPAEPSAGEASDEEEASPPSAFGGMEAFAQFGGDETATEESRASEEVPTSQVSGLEAMFGGPAPAAAIVEDDFDIYAARKRGELGPTDVITFEEYLASPSPQPEAWSGETASGEPAGADDPFAAAGFPMTGESPSQEDVVVEETATQELSGIGEETPTDIGAEAVPEEGTGFGFEDAVSEEPAEPQESELSPETADQTVEETPSFEPAGAEAYISAEPAGDQTFEAFTIPEEVPETAEAAVPAGGDMFAGFESAGEATEEAAPEPEQEAETETPAFPDFSGLPGFEGPDLAPPEETGSEAEEVTEEGFTGPAFEEPEPPRSSSDKIGEFAEKLQEAKKITPVIDLTMQVTSSSTSSADEAAVDAGFVTPTLAEIYAKQGWYDDAINAYKTLAKTRPAEKEKFEERVKELQEEKAKAD